eukprot:TRINITY_DN9369_c0_g1_i2.p2 TRINITY_DN9369_c0_g1~~TRINITY_DN9369_c0_g1_i2.p2  ORF type:complete len:114 (-),score=32.95 TRINITY_DN9369_c0_g1_i2:295-636(-)
MCVAYSYCFFFFFSSRRRHTRSCLVSWARRCVQETENTLTPSNSEKNLSENKSKDLQQQTVNALQQDTANIQISNNPEQQKTVQDKAKQDQKKMQNRTNVKDLLKKMDQVKQE